MTDRARRHVESLRTYLRNVTDLALTLNRHAHNEKEGEEVLQRLTGLRSELEAARVAIATLLKELEATP